MKKIFCYFQIIALSLVLAGCNYADMQKYYKNSLKKQGNFDNFYCKIDLTEGNTTNPAKIYKSGNNVRIEKSLNKGRNYGYISVTNGKKKIVYMSNATIGQRSTHSNDKYMNVLLEMQKWGDGKDLKKFIFSKNISNDEMTCALFVFDDKKNNVIEELCIDNRYGIAVLYDKTKTVIHKNRPSETFKKRIVVKDIKTRQKFKPSLFTPPAHIKIIDLK